MSAGVLLPMLGSSNTATKTANTRTSKSSNSSNESFKSEMDKAYDKSGNSSKVDKKQNENKVDKPVEKPQKDQPVDKKDVDNSESISKDDEQAISAEEQALLLAAQVNQAISLNLVPQDKEEVLNGPSNPLLGMVQEKTNEKADLNILDKLAGVELGEDGSIKLPTTNNVDLAKAAILKSLQSQNTEQQTQTFEQHLTEIGDVENENMQKSDGGELTKTNKDDAMSNTITNEDGDGIAKESIALKNNLDLSKVNIKVAEAPVDTTRADMAKQLAEKIMYKAGQGKEEFDIELNPRNLGKINIKMIFTNGTAELVMSTSNPKTHQLLSGQTEALKAILEGNTGVDSNINLKQTENSEGQFDRDNFQEQNKNNQQNQKQQKEEQKLNDSLSFVDRLRLGLVTDLEQTG